MEVGGEARFRSVRPPRMRSRNHSKAMLRDGHTNEGSVVTGGVWSQRLAGLDELGAARAGVRDVLADVGTDDSAIFDGLLVLTELVTNGFEHAEPSWMEVEVVTMSTGVRLTVSHDHREPPMLPERPSMPGSADRRGRGLAIVAAVAERLDVEVDEDVTCVTATLAVGN